MEINTSKPPRRAGRAPSLEALVSDIDRQLDQVPSLSTTEGIAAFMGGCAENYQRKTEEQYIRFFLGSIVFALSLQNTLEIDYVPEIIPLPNLPQWVQGICNLRGDIVSVVDLRLILHLKPAKNDSPQKLILIRDKDVSTAIIVDGIAGMLPADAQDKGKMPADATFSKFVKKILISGRQTVHLIDLDALMPAIKI